MIENDSTYEVNGEKVFHIVNVAYNVCIWYSQNVLDLSTTTAHFFWIKKLMSVKNFAMLSQC